MFSERGRAVLLIGIFILVAGFAFTNYILTLLGIFLIVGSVASSPYFQATMPVETLEVTREIDKRNIFQDDFIHVKLTVKNSGSHRIDSVDIFDVYPEIFRLVLGKNSIRTRIDPNQEVKFSYVLQAPLRGKFTFGPTKFQIHDRLEFRFEELSGENYEDLLIYPNVEEVRIMESLAQKRRLGYMFGIHKTRQMSMGTDFTGIRRYEAGDEYRRIDWKSSARTRKLMMRQYETERNIRMLIVLDTGATMGAGRPEYSKLEAAIRSALMLAKMAMERKDHVGLLTWSTKQHSFLKPGLGEAHYHRLLDQLAEIEAGGTFDLTAVVEYLAPRVSQQSFFIILTDLESNRKRFEKGIRLIRGYKHNALIITPFGPWFEIEEIYLSPVERAIGEAVVHRLLEEQSALAKSLRRVGVSVVPVGPGDFLPTVLSEYLKAKKRSIAVI
ncbi:MAG: DUF58 domain-containing protein [Candidatus Odinarchaeota archaeon]